MEKNILVENIQLYCELKGEKPTPACNNAGVGKDLYTKLKQKDVYPSIEKMYQLAQYLGVTVSDLLGETGRFAEYESAPGSSVKLPGVTTEELELLAAYRRADEDDKTAVRLILKKYAKKASTGATDAG